jgi:hypothetical protein
MSAHATVVFDSGGGDAPNCPEALPPVREPSFTCYDCAAEYITPEALKTHIISATHTDHEFIPWIQDMRQYMQTYPLLSDIAKHCCTFHQWPDGTLVYTSDFENVGDLYTLGKPFTSLLTDADIAHAIEEELEWHTYTDLDRPPQHDMPEIADELVLQDRCQDLFSDHPIWDTIPCPGGCRHLCTAYVMIHMIATFTPQTTDWMSEFLQSTHYHHIKLAHLFSS